MTVLNSCGPLLLLSLLAATVKASLIPDTEYSFENFIIDFERSYDSAEYAVRQRIFEENLQKILQHNNHDKSSYKLGINQWADHAPGEVHMGYDKSFATTATSRRRALQVDAEEEHPLPITIEPVASLPSSVSYAHIATPIKNQGMCGSCWAFASSAVLESHVALATSVPYELSPQALVSCVNNSMHCGGDGGCQGATAELAFDLVKKRGMVEEWEFGYREENGEDVPSCGLEKAVDKNGFWKKSVVGIEDYVVLPSNNYTVLMNVIAKMGPVAVSVACHPWLLYHSGVFYSPLSEGKSATDLNHLVVLEGYGTDTETGEDYWLVRNSWGPRWGEGGYIRLKRVGEEECAYDRTPADGSACTLDPDGNPIEPDDSLICGNSGILFETVIPVGGYLL